MSDRDLDKVQIRENVPPRSFDSTRLLLPVAAEYLWIERKTENKSAYLLAKSINRESFVRPPKEKDDGKALRGLLVPVCSLTLSERLRVLTLHKVLRRRFGFPKS